MRAVLLVCGLAVAGTANAAPVDLMPRQPQQGGVAVIEAAGRDEGLDRWIARFRPRARAKGISDSTFENAFRSVRFNAEVIEKDRQQSEFSKSIWDYLDSAVSDKRLTNGLNALRQHRELLDRIEAAYGVDKEVVVAVWGMESSYGELRGSHPVIGALATLAYDGRRGAFFEDQLVAALQIVQSGDVRPENMTGSWAGAMGHTQFIPTSYLAVAVDFTGDGKRDIWSDDPTDALASTAAYLAKSGWQSGSPWGYEVKLPPGFDYAQSGKKRAKPVADWQALGLRAADGGGLPDHGAAALLLPAGARGAAFLIFRNFNTIERYNAADAYVIGVGHLSDRLKGGAAIQGSWPRDDRALLAVERLELQERLTAAGFDTGGVDGRIGPNTIAAIRSFQTAAGLVPDGYAGLELLKHLR